MKIKRIVIPFITLVIMTSQLAGCATMNSDEMLKSMTESPDVSIEYAIPDEEQQSSDASGVITVGDQQFVVDSNSETSGTENESDIGIIEQQEVKELSGAELEEYFQLAYDSGASIEGDLETRIQRELGILLSLVDADETIKLPSDYADQYRDWRPADQVQLFEDCNETVYATGTVNIRASYTADSEKLGSLSAGDSATRTGIAIAGTEAEGWSRIQLSDGTVVYISNQYLSTTKPVQQQNTQSQGNQQTQTSGSQQQTQQTQQTSSSQKIDGHDDLGDYVLNGKGGKYYPALGITLPVSYDGTTTNGAPPQTAEEQEAAKKEYEAGLESSEHHTESWAGVSMGG